MPVWMFALVFVAGGCNKLFDLEPVEVGGTTGDGGTADDGSGSGTEEDARTDGAPGGCAPMPSLAHDEDGDGIDDLCDGCPTQSSTSLDTDGDGLPDKCDRSTSTLDEIKRVWLFANASDTAGLTLTSATHNSLGNGSLELRASTTVETNDAFLPTRIEVNVRGAAPTSAAGKLSVSLTGLVACEVKAQACTTTADSTCGTVVPSSNTGATLGTAISALKRVVLVDQSGAHCEISNSSATVGAVGSAAFAPKTIRITTSSDLSVFVDSIVIYGLK